MSRSRMRSLIVKKVNVITCEWRDLIHSLSILFVSLQYNNHIEFKVIERIFDTYIGEPDCLSRFK